MSGPKEEQRRDQTGMLESLKESVLENIDYILKNTSYEIEFSNDKKNFTVNYDNSFIEIEPETFELNSVEAYRWTQAVLTGNMTAKVTQLRRLIESPLENLKKFQGHKSKPQLHYVSMSIDGLNNALKEIEDLEELRSLIMNYSSK